MVPTFAEIGKMLLVECIESVDEGPLNSFAHPSPNTE